MTPPRTGMKKPGPGDSFVSRLRTAGAASPPRCRSTCLNLSLPPKRRAGPPAWDWPRFTAWSVNIPAGSKSNPPQERDPVSRSSSLAAPAALDGYQVIKLSGYQVIKLSSYQVIKLSSCRVITFLDY